MDPLGSRDNKRSETLPLLSSSPRGIRLMLLGVAIVVAFLNLPLLHANAAEQCRNKATVKQSAKADQNTADGGHVTQHIYGMNAPAGKSQAHKTLFTSKAEYTGVWNNYETSATIVGIDCSGLGTKRQQVSVQALLKKSSIGAKNCSAGAVGGQCTASTKTTCEKIQLDFEKNASQDWILVTAYPIDCKS